MQCHFINQEEYNELSKTISEDDALEKSRCQADAVEGYTRCEEHGGADITHFYSGNMMPDQKLRFKELFINVMDTYKIPRDNLLVTNIISATCREIILSHNADPSLLRSGINQALAYAKELNLTPKERKGNQSEFHIHMDENMKGAVDNIESIVKERLALQEQ